MLKGRGAKGETYFRTPLSITDPKTTTDEVLPGTTSGDHLTQLESCEKSVLESFTAQNKVFLLNLNNETPVR